MPPTRNNNHGSSRTNKAVNFDRKMRKPLVEKKRRARINDSLQELREFIADAELQSKMENAEVLELTVKRVESILQNHAEEVEAVNREACERFAAGYIQCMHDVHTFVSSCPGIDPCIAEELLNHLLESMPLNNQDKLDNPSCNSSLSLSENTFTALVSPSPSTISTDDLSSDLDEIDSEQNQVSSQEETEAADVSSSTSFKTVWRPW